ncbi:MAG: hypothetical protein ACJ0Q6_00070 [Candidatus Azotimanducaceae bacterium]|nr:hypothetical protein [Gammaproteobacteria bacterium]OUV66997.1 MAG: hypothetical protein CBC93_06755 [Gammaproteobacteria bacterium TMED133]
MDDLFINVSKIDGANEFLSQTAQNLSVGLATGSHREACALKLKDKFWRNVFEGTICGDDQRLERPKPGSDIFLLCADTKGRT